MKIALVFLAALCLAQAMPTEDSDEQVMTRFLNWGTNFQQDCYEAFPVQEYEVTYELDWEWVPDNCYRGIKLNNDNVSTRMATI